jgi:hypothetical protein
MLKILKCRYMTIILMVFSIAIYLFINLLYSEINLSLTSYLNCHNCYTVVKHLKTSGCFIYQKV